MSVLVALGVNPFSIDSVSSSTSFSVSSSISSSVMVRGGMKRMALGLTGLSSNPASLLMVTTLGVSRRP